MKKTRFLEQAVGVFFLAILAGLTSCGFGGGVPVTDLTDSRLDFLSPSEHDLASGSICSKEDATNATDEIKELNLVDCDSAHTHELYMVTRRFLAADPDLADVYPGVDSLRDFALSECTGGAISVLGKPISSTQFRLSYLFPNMDTWNDKQTGALHRSALCFLVHPGRDNNGEELPDLTTHAQDLCNASSHLSTMHSRFSIAQIVSDEELFGVSKSELIVTEKGFGDFFWLTPNRGAQEVLKLPYSVAVKVLRENNEGETEESELFIASPTIVEYGFSGLDERDLLGISDKIGEPLAFSILRNTESNENIDAGNRYWLEIELSGAAANSSSLPFVDRLSLDINFVRASDIHHTYATAETEEQHSFCYPNKS